MRLEGRVICEITCKLFQLDQGGGGGPRGGMQGRVSPAARTRREARRPLGLRRFFERFAPMSKRQMPGVRGFGLILSTTRFSLLA